MRINWPQIYRTNKGVLMVFISKIVLFGYIVLFSDWYLVFIPFFLLQILKYIAFSQSLKNETKEFVIHLNKKRPEAKQDELEKEAKEIARNTIFEYKNRKLRGSFLDKIFYYIA
ncbi:MAG: hypothetical protein CO002_03925 [Candidatus Portnoybacteria bacterium CG_4_8_14_3_um_filter_44_10]|nr:MAG: hypothetical protein AUK17_00180 [Parcubacteria group bacterium CG2_30_44_18]PIW75099.1 MAG: hypothetical protein CO002_03925 [Candidatus Portnoybacteria bacterium CG_4_8_14_3_um_filter_44_10]PJA62805.1 MAG: hypothetical protein CO161_04475 [Candidatus Portnoybacteria bacterium CG_4_9_14_3_um_filter_44_9]